MQKTDFNFEVLIHDDASTDGTREIIEEYARKYPDIIKPFYEKENQYSKGKLIQILHNLYNKCKTKYVALCEGDDYWTDPYKLQKQVDFLEAHPEYSACFHPVKIVWENNEHKNSIYPAKKKMLGKKFITKEDLLEYNYIQTNSVVYRWRFVDKDIREFFPEGILPGDLYLHLLHAQIGNIAYLPDIMAVYRRQPNGIWFNADNRILKYGIQIAKFHYEVWKNITNSSEKFLNDTLLPTINHISDIYYQNQKFDEIKILKDTYNDIYDKALKIETKDAKKLKKYKKLYSLFLIISIALLLLNFVQLFLNIR